MNYKCFDMESAFEPRGNTGEAGLQRPDASRALPGNLISKRYDLSALFKDIYYTERSLLVISK